MLVSSFVLWVPGGHLKAGQRAQAGTVVLLPCLRPGRQVNFGRPASRAALQDVPVVSHLCERGDRHGEPVARSSGVEVCGFFERPRRRTADRSRGGLRYQLSFVGLTAVLPITTNRKNFGHVWPVDPLECREKALQRQLVGAAISAIGLTALQAGVMAMSEHLK